MTSENKLTPKNVECLIAYLVLKGGHVTTLDDPPVGALVVEMSKHPQFRDGSGLGFLRSITTHDGDKVYEIERLDGEGVVTWANARFGALPDRTAEWALDR